MPPLYSTRCIRGQTALISGGSVGIGRACALLLAEQGASLILVARRLDKLEDAHSELKSRFPEVDVRLEVCDLSNTTQIEDLILRLHDVPIHIIVNNAGLALGTEAGDLSCVKDTITMFNTNVIASMALVSGIAPQMRKRNAGEIVNIGSIAASDHYSGGAIYCATKSAIEAYSNCLRMDLVDTNIRVTLICPGIVSGTEFSLVRFRGDGDKALTPYAGLDCLTPMDVADQVVYSITRPINVQIAQINSYCNQQGHAKYVVSRK